MSLLFPVLPIAPPGYNFQFGYDLTEPQLTIPCLHATSKWHISIGSAANADATIDHVVNEGWNCGPLGNAIDATEPVMSWAQESNFLAAPGVRYMERHLNFVSTTGVARRPLAVLWRRDSVFNSIVGIAGNFNVAISDGKAVSIVIEDGSDGANRSCFFGDQTHGACIPTAYYNNISALSQLDTAGTTTSLIRLDATGGTQALARSSSNETWAFVDGQTLTVNIDGFAQTFTAHTADYANIAAVTKAELAAAMNAQLLGSPASVVATHVDLSSAIVGSISQVRITGGALNAVLAFNTAANVGSGVAARDIVQIAPAGNTSWCRGPLYASGPIVPQSYTVAGLPPVNSFTYGLGGAGALISVSNDFSGAATPVFSDGTNWRRVRDGLVTSTTDNSGQVGAPTINNVTPGGVADTINDIVAAPIDVNAASLTSTRDAIYQLTVKVAALEAALRAIKLVRN